MSRYKIINLFFLWLPVSILIVGLIFLLTLDNDQIFRVSLISSLLSLFVSCIALLGTRVDVIGTDRRADKVSWLFEFVRCRNGANFSFLRLGDLDVKDVRVSVAESVDQVHNFSAESLKSGVVYPGISGEAGTVSKFFIPISSDLVSITIHVSWSVKSKVGDFRMSDVYHVSIAHESWWRLGKRKYIAVKL